MADPKIAIAITLDPAHEGGYQRNPNDRANWSGGQIGKGILVGTKYGITALDMPGVNIEDITPEQAADYYLANYWKPLYSQINSQEIANKLFDMGVLFGVGTAVSWLQHALDLGKVDGIFGPNTLQFTNQVNATLLLAAFKEGLHDRALHVAMTHPEEATNLPDWQRRIDS